VARARIAISLWRTLVCCALPQQSVAASGPFLAIPLCLSLSLSLTLGLSLFLSLHVRTHTSHAHISRTLIVSCFRFIALSLLSGSFARLLFLSCAYAQTHMRENTHMHTHTHAHAHTHTHAHTYTHTHTNTHTHPHTLHTHPHAHRHKGTKHQPVQQHTTQSCYKIVEMFMARTSICCPYTHLTYKCVMLHKTQTGAMHKMLQLRATHNRHKILKMLLDEHLYRDSRHADSPVFPFRPADVSELTDMQRYVCV